MNEGAIYLMHTGTAPWQFWSKVFRRWLVLGSLPQMPERVFLGRFAVIIPGYQVVISQN